MNLTTVVSSLTREAKQLTARLDVVNKALSTLRTLGGKPAGKRKLSRKARAAIVAGQKRRWAKVKAAKKA